MAMSMATATLLNAGIGASSNLAGGFIQAGESKKSRKFAKRQNALNRQHQINMAQNAIRWRTKDAKLAGIHPLYALGAPSFNAAPSQIHGGKTGGVGESIAKAGQSITSALSRLQTRQQVAHNQATIRLLESQSSESDARAGYYRDLANNMEGHGRENPSGGLGPQMESQNPNVPSGVGVIDLEPSKQISTTKGDPSTVAGTHAFNANVQLAPGLRINMPKPDVDESPQEVFNEMSNTAFASMVMRNTQRHGKKWLLKFIDWYALGGTTGMGQKKKIPPFRGRSIRDRNERISAR